MALKIKNRFTYFALIGTFVLLYLCVAFVSTLHAVTFFELANKASLAILLGAAYEIGQAAVLFSILMTNNKNRLLAWGMMILLTALQVTANVYASFKFMDQSTGTDWTYWQRSILFAVQGQTPEQYKVIISWISGALLPLVALGMTALVAENIQLVREESTENKNIDIPLGGELDEIVENEINRRMSKLNSNKNESHQAPKDIMNNIVNKFNEYNKAEEIRKENNIKFPSDISELKPQIELQLQEKPKQLDDVIKEENEIKEEVLELNNATIDFEKAMQVAEEGEPEKEEIPEISLKTETKTVKAKPSKFKVTDKELIPVPVNKIRGWHFKKEYVDDEHNVFEKGKFIKNDPTKTPTSKKA